MLTKTTLYKNIYALNEDLLKIKKHSVLVNQMLEKTLVVAELVFLYLNKIKNSSSASKIESKIRDNIYALVPLVSLSDNSFIKKKYENFIKSFNNFINNRKKILILAVSWGYGHISAANAIKEGIEKKYGLDYEVKILDFVEFCNKYLNLTIKKTYKNSAKYASPLYKFFYEKSDSVNSAKLISILSYPLLYPKLNSLLARERPDLIISVSPFYNELIKRCWDKCELNPHKFITVITDSTRVHKSWLSASSDYIIVADEDTKNKVCGEGFASNTVFSFGIPVKLTKKTAGTIRKEIGIDKRHFVLLYIFNVTTRKKEIEYLKKINKETPNILLIIITGKKSPAVIKSELKKIKWNIPARIIGWAEDLTEFIKISNAIVTKAGGVIVAECLAMEKPMLITKSIPGQEEGNLQYIEKYGLGYRVKSADNIADIVLKLSKKNSIELKKLQKNLKKVSRKNSAFLIAGLAGKILR